MDIEEHKKWSKELLMYCNMLPDQALSILNECESILNAGITASMREDNLTPAMLCELALRRLQSRISDIQGCFDKVQASLSK